MTLRKSAKMQMIVQLGFLPMVQLTVFEWSVRDRFLITAQLRMRNMSRLPPGSKSVPADPEIETAMVDIDPGRPGSAKGCICQLK